jgi:hypothetical protein
MKLKFPIPKNLHSQDIGSRSACPWRGAHTIALGGANSIGIERIESKDTEESFDSTRSLHWRLLDFARVARCGDEDGCLNR